MKYTIFVIFSMLLIPLTSSAKTFRSTSVKAEFQRLHPCPATGKSRGACPGYVKDHIIALDCGGPDSVENMQWQTVTEGKAKDKWERKECGEKNH